MNTCGKSAEGTVVVKRLMQQLIVLYYIEWVVNALYYFGQRDLTVKS